MSKSKGKIKSYFVCKECGSRQLKWVGRCPDCGEWDSLVEEQLEVLSRDVHRPTVPIEQKRPIELSEDMSQFCSEDGLRFSSGIGELDRVLGGGLVEGATILLGGAPGIGKSTLLLQSADKIAGLGKKVLYVTSEESEGQVKLRAERLGIGGSNILVSSQTNLEVILNHIRQDKPDVVMIDSIQLVYKPDLSSAPGSVSQLRQCATEFVWLSKSTGITVVLVGHITKQGIIAGPKILEHIVDVVLYFEGDSHHSHRLIRAAKNRFGATNELGVFEMDDSGLVEISDPAGLFLQAGYSNRSGSVILCASEGTRILMIEVQALTSSSIPGLVRRKCRGIDSSRLAMILAVLERHCGLKLANKDVFVNVVGGVKVTEPACDLAIALAVAGAYFDRRMPESTAVFGEIGLAGELRAVPFGGNRISEANRLGLKAVVSPVMHSRAEKADRIKNIQCRHLQEVIELLE